MNTNNQYLLLPSIHRLHTYKLTSKKELHKNIIPIEYGNHEEGIEVEGAIHSHLPETGEFITATDICTLMLYSKFAKWKPPVVSLKFASNHLFFSRLY